MKGTIGHSHGGFTRTISVSVTADQGVQFTRVRTEYDGFVLGDDVLQPPASAYHRSFTKTEGITPNQPHRVVVTAYDTNNKTDSCHTAWND